MNITDQIKQGMMRHQQLENGCDSATVVETIAVFSINPSFDDEYWKGFGFRKHPLRSSLSFVKPDELKHYMFLYNEIAMFSLCLALYYLPDLFSRDYKTRIAAMIVDMHIHKNKTMGEILLGCFGTENNAYIEMARKVSGYINCQNDYHFVDLFVSHSEKYYYKKYSRDRIIQGASRLLDLLRPSAALFSKTKYPVPDDIQLPNDEVLKYFYQ